MATMTATTNQMGTEQQAGQALDDKLQRELTGMAMNKIYHLDPNDPGMRSKLATDVDIMCGAYFRHARVVKLTSDAQLRYLPRIAHKLGHPMCPISTRMPESPVLPNDSASVMARLWT